MTTRVSVLLSLQRALLDAVTPNLRAVLATFDDASLRIEAFFDGEIGEGEREVMSLVETEVLADFDPSYSIACDVIRLDAPAPIPKDRTEAVYRRKEPFSA